MRRTAITLAVLLGTAVAPPTTHADDALPSMIPVKARRLANACRAYHDAGDYTAAIAAFKEAYVLAPSPGLLFNLAQAYRLAGNCDDAAWMYRRFLDTHPPDTHRALAEHHLANVEKCGSGGLRLTVVPPKAIARLSIPDEDNAVTQTTRTPIDPGRAPRAYKRIGTGAAIAGGAALVGAAYYALQSREAARAVEDAYDNGGEHPDIAAVDARGQRDASIATALAIGGGVALASGAILYGLGRHFEKAQRVSVTPSPRGAGVSLSWGF